MTVSSFLYRFRPLSRLISGGELENQEIYFADPKQLNDPMEGFRDIYWKGDSIVWRNFFRHYLICLDNVYTQFAIIGEEEAICWEHIPLFNHGNMNDGTPRKEAETAIVSRFLAEPYVQQLIDLLSDRNFPIRRNELTAYIRGIHLFALTVIRQVNAERGLEVPSTSIDSQNSKTKETIKLSIEALRYLQNFEIANSTDEQQSDKFYASHNHLMTQMELINLYNGSIKIESANRNFVLFNFPNEYALNIECLIYPKWYAACFMSDCRDSSIWGTYGDRHTAVCLKFRTEGSDDRRHLRLKREYGYGPEGPAIGFVPHPFYKVVYENKPESVDFFRLLGRFPEQVLREKWFTDDAGNISPCGHDVFYDQDAWRDRYWGSFHRDIVRKLDHWSHEREHRLILSGDLIDFSSAASRVTTYDFNDLDGIIFGINTSLRDKIEICKIIENKCRKERRKKFHFYQARYQASTGTIEHDEMALLKFET